MQHDSTEREISIADLERELELDEAFSQAVTEQMAAVEVDGFADGFDDERTGVYEIRPSTVLRMAQGSGQVYWVALAR